MVSKCASFRYEKGKRFSQNLVEKKKTEKQNAKEP